MAAGGMASTLGAGKPVVAFMQIIVQGGRSQPCWLCGEVLSYATHRCERHPDGSHTSTTEPLEAALCHWMK
jgi:hypothetical protein